MDPSPSRSPAAAGLPLAPHAEVEVIIAEPAWRRFVARPECVARHSASAIGGAATIVLANDTEVKRLNVRHRARNKPTNVLTFEPAAPGLPGEIVLALGNTLGVSTVEANFAALQKTMSKMVEVKKGDTLWKIAEAQYGKGKGDKYPVIFEANKPMLTHPDKIYPGQMLRIPPL